MSIEQGNTKIHSEPEKNRVDMKIMKGIAIAGYLGLPISALVAYLSTNPNYDCSAGFGGLVSFVAAGAGTWGIIAHRGAVKGVANQMEKEGENRRSQGAALMNEGEYLINHSQRMKRSVGIKK